jgi:hypothetical protein
LYRLAAKRYALAVPLERIGLEDYPPLPVHQVGTDPARYRADQDLRLDVEARNIQRDGAKCRLERIGRFAARRVDDPADLRAAGTTRGDSYPPEQGSFPVTGRGVRDRKGLGEGEAAQTLSEGELLAGGDADDLVAGQVSAMKLNT